MQGVANDANIVALQIFSFDTVTINRNAKIAPTVFREDALAFIQAILSGTTQGTTSNPYTLVMSFANGGSHVNVELPLDGGCRDFGRSLSTPPADTSAAFATAIAQLYARGVPAVAATGNFYDRARVSWPACVKHVIKVGALVNDTNTPSIHPRGNLSNPIGFPGDQWYVAPGFFITSSVLPPFPSPINTTFSTTASYGGTSFAAPHVAGLYAIIKAAIPGISVSDATAYINNNLSQELPQTCGLGYAPTGCYKFRRLLIPALP